LDGDDRERTFIQRELLERRNHHALLGDLTQPVRDSPEFWNGLNRLLNSKELARRELPAPVVSRKAISTVENAVADGMQNQESGVACLNIDDC
jgi:hypothetical protein